jgi:uncharacterized protein YihD (DUF1040 family)
MDWTSPGDVHKRFKIFKQKCELIFEGPLEETARLLVDDSGYDAAFKDETLRDTLVFGLKSDKARKDAIAKGNALTFQQVYNLAKKEESTKAQMKAMSQKEDETELHSVRSKMKSTTSSQYKPQYRQA